MSATPSEGGGEEQYFPAREEEDDAAAWPGGALRERLALVAARARAGYKNALSAADDAAADEEARRDAEDAIAHCSRLIARYHAAGTAAAASSQPPPVAAANAAAVDATQHKVVTLADGDDVPDWLFAAAMDLRPAEPESVTTGASQRAPAAAPARRRTRKVQD